VKALGCVDEAFYEESLDLKCEYVRQVRATSRLIPRHLEPLSSLLVPAAYVVFAARQTHEGAVTCWSSRSFILLFPAAAHTTNTRPTHACTAARLQFGANILVMGDDHTGRFGEVENEGCSRVFLERTAGVSTSERLMFIACGEPSARANNPAVLTLRPLSSLTSSPRPRPSRHHLRDRRVAEAAASGRPSRHFCKARDS
jgi:hypothetical protein